MLVSNTIINRLKTFYGNTDRSHKQPHISSLERLPVELLQSIVSHLPLSSAACFALSNKYICYGLGRQYWQHLRSQPLEYEIFLGFLEKDTTSHWLCHQCLIFHLKPKIHPIVKYGLARLPWPRWKCVQPFYYLSRTMSTPYGLPSVLILHLMVRMAMNCHLLGSEHGEPLAIFFEPTPSSSHMTYRPSPTNWDRISTEACIVANELYVRCQHRFEIPSSKNFEYIPPQDICPHIRSSDPENPMAPIIICLLSHRNTASCENCKGLRQCSSCTTEFEIRISPLGPTDHPLETTYWKIFGAGRSSDDLKWMQHELVWVLTCRLLNSRLGAFRLRLNPKNTKICKFVLAISYVANRFHVPKENWAAFVLPSVDIALYKLR